MAGKINFKLLSLVLTVLILTCVFWTLLFYKHAVISKVIWDINIIFLSVVVFYVAVKNIFSEQLIDFVKIYVRIIFRVWLLIFITFSMYQGETRVGFLLSISFIFGYFEGLIDIENWLKSGKHPIKLQPQFLANTTLTSILFLSGIHFSCAIILWLFFKYY
jgi:hypothetical protein